MIFSFFILHQEKSLGQCDLEEKCFNNLVLNPGFEEDCITPSPDGLPYWHAFEGNTRCVTDWEWTEGSPHLIVSPFNATPPANNGGDFYVCLQAINNDMTDYCYREGIHTPLKSNLKFYENQAYNIKLLARSASITNDIIIGPDSAPIQFSILLANGFTAPNSTDSDCQEVFDQKQQIYYNNFDEDNWTDLDACSFIPDRDYDFLAFRVTNGTVRTAVNSLLLLDNVQVWCESQIELSASSTNISGNTYQFNASVTNDIQDVNVVSWHWDFGDGSTSEDQNPTHTFDHGGFFKACLCITDNRGCTRQICTEGIQSCYCTEFQEITSDITYTGNVSFDKNLVILPGVKVTFDGANAKFYGNCKVLVQRHARLNILSSTLQEAECESLNAPWGGIQVWGSWTHPHTPTSSITSSLSLLDDNQGIVYTSNSTIKNVYNEEFDGAISAGPNPPFLAYMDTPLSSTWEGYFGGIIITTSSTNIENCRKGISFQRFPAPGISFSTSSWINNTVFTGCRFGVTSSWNEGLVITNSGFTLPSLSTIKSNTAITCLNGRTSISNSTINKYAHGIDGLSSQNPNMLLFIGDKNNHTSHNAFNDCKLGVALQNVRNTDAFSNQFNRNIANDNDAGVWVDGPNGFNMYNNIYTNTLVGNVIENSFGSTFNSQTNLNCNQYSGYSNAILAKGSNDLLGFDKETFGYGNVAVFYDKSSTNLGKVPIQGSYSSPRINEFNNSNFDIYTPSASFSQTDNFYYYYPNGVAPNAPLRPTCATNASYCTATGNFNETEAIGSESNDCPQAGPVFCVTQLCLDTLNDLRASNRNNLANGASHVLLQNVISYTSDFHVISALNAASPYLSDSILIALISNNNFTESQKLNYLLQHASLSHQVRYIAGSYMTTNSVNQLDTIYAPSKRDSAEFALKQIDSQRWGIIANLVSNMLNDTSYNTIRSLINAQEDSLTGRRLLLEAQKAIGKWDDGNATINGLTDISNDYKKLLRTELKLDRYYNYSLAPSEFSVLDSFEFEDSPSGSLARSIYERIDHDRQYYPEFPTSPESERKAEKDKFASISQVNYVTIEPNPTKDYVDIEVVEEYQQLFTGLEYEIYNTSGYLIKRGKILNTRLHLDTSEWSAGIYFMKIAGKEGIQLKKIIK